MRLIFLVFLICVSAFGEQLTFSVHGKDQKTLDLDTMKKMVGTKKLEINNRHVDERITYEGVPFRELLTKVYGKSLGDGDELLFTCSDGYKPSVPISRFSKFASVLAYARADGKKFEFANKEKSGDITTYAPFFLIWDNIKDKALEKEGFEYWPYQLVSVDVIRFSDRFPNTAPPANSTAAAKEGFVAFRSQCMNCHTINGEGGARGIELNYPMNITEYMKDSVLIQWMKDPKKVRYNATMPRVTPDYPNRDQMINNVVQYLKAMVKNKKAPKPD
jgi:mono/diheme cytochrome c family protein